ncbi:MULTISPECIES: DNA gyrase inhibitor YacG [Polyangium]|uniref:DNA gyrase inhibitor YacG n=2 Tax=Polyangium TaxID=55 RepID=A0A4U1JIH1_9BACT|nr:MULTISPECIES: DNA gyrase inhibitor YacG [Polyangium]MDI1432561.1 DNA gyrase inhibitor YacG [Polyangium sorediatum]TKD12304.1 DNA gyrase inhibitor YacG [Polyangium fumosum]
MGASSRPTCPQCGREAVLGPENPARPFCSARCKVLDLERWLTGAYRVPGPPVDTSMLEGEGTRREDDPDEPKGDEET